MMEASVPGIYISYPFCAQKCTFCNFASGVYPRELERRYMETLQREVGACEFPWRPETLYLGGGTPSGMDVGDLAALLALVPGRPWTEATIEAAPGGITAERARAWSAAGIDRASLGAQSFVPKEIARTGRKHTAAIVEAEVALLRRRGIRKINIDLIAGLPGQTEASWRESLDWLERIAPEHVSIYMLEVDDDSRLGRELRLGGVRYGAADAPSDELTADLYEIAAERLAQMGIRRYEISNFARPGMESRHNLKYWLLEPYLGFGADAHSFDGHSRWSNAESPQEYVAAPRAPGAEERSCSADERFFVGLRLTGGIRPEPAEWQRFHEPIQRFLDAGLLETNGGNLRLTSRGILLSNEVFQEFLT
jgi:oxygen-independent coproporphyrinogen-3 oxidase